MYNKNFFKELKTKILNFLKENKLLCFIFGITTLLFFYQHLKNISWDFSAYVLNAKYLFFNGTYYETLRPPLAPVILGLFLIFGAIGEYFYIFLVSLLFLYANVSLADCCFDKFVKKDKIEKKWIRLLFYFFSLGAFTLQYSISSGTELLGLALLELFITSIIKGKVSGYYLGLAFLSRYSVLIFLPLMILNKNIKKIILNFLTFFGTIFPWLLFNYIHWGNPFTSIIDSYVNNILFRQYLYQSFNPLQILTISNLFLPFILIGLIIGLFSILIKRQNWFEENKIIFLFLFLTSLILYDYKNIPLKQIRYLFNLTLPFAFFSTYGVLFLTKINKLPKKIIKISLIILFIVNYFSILSVVNLTKGYSSQFYSASSKVKELNIENCEILSPHWVLVSYFTENVYPLGRNEISSSLSKNKIILIFKKETTIDDLFNKGELIKNRVLYENEDYSFLIGQNFSIENCSKKYIYDSPYISNHCGIISERFNYTKVSLFLERGCNIFQRKNNLID